MDSLDEGWLEGVRKEGRVYAAESVSSDTKPPQYAGKETIKVHRISITEKILQNTKVLCNRGHLNLESSS